MINHKKLNSVVTELFIIGKKIKYFLCLYYAIVL